MRIPIFPKDVEPGKGVLRLARLLQRDWPGEDRIGLGAAQNLMSRCLGYADFHDVKMSADRAELIAASLDDLRAQAFETIKNEVKKSNFINDADLEELRENIVKWPFHNLAIYRILGTPSSLPFSALLRHDAEMMTRYYMTGQIENIGLREINEKVQSGFGHFSTNSTAQYLPTLGFCRSELPASPPEGLIVRTECMTCGPALIKKLSERT